MDKIKTRPWDSAEHLKTDDDMAEYFDACLREAGDDPAFIAHALGVIARARGMSQVARLYPALEANLRTYVFGKEFDTPIRPALHGDSSGIRGAAWLWPKD